MSDSLGFPRVGTLGLGVAAGVGVLSLLVLLGEYGRRQITRITRSDFRDDPAKWGLAAAEELWLTARDGVRLHAWLFTSPSATSTVILCHGHNGNKHTLLPLAEILFPRHNVLLLDSRGHGESAGDRCTIGYEERLDVYAAVDELERRRLGPIGILGVSMGAVVAILAAAEDARIAAVIADSPFARLRWAVAEVARVHRYPPLVAPFMAQVACRSLALRLRYPLTAFDPIEVVERIAPRPLLLIHGERDEIIDVRHSRLVFERAGEPKELWVLPGLLHCRGLEEACEAYGERISRFFETWLAPRMVGADVEAVASGVGEPATNAATDQMHEVPEDQPAHIHRTEHLRAVAGRQVDLDPGLDRGRDHDEDDGDGDALDDADPARAAAGHIAAEEQGAKLERCCRSEVAL
ncbi:MAG: alpha/beta hydrolase [Chloroflexi bacterium]|nr:alpha/beta hydrolase [Chloroflexota bacterium]